MKKEELKDMVREIVREELANYLRTGLGALEVQEPITAHQSNKAADEAADEANVDDAFKLLEQHSDVMASWMRWAEDEVDETEWQDFDG